MEKTLTPDEISEFVLPITKMFCDIFTMRKSTMLSTDLVNIVASVVTSMIASCIEDCDPCNTDQFKSTLYATVDTLAGILEGGVFGDREAFDV